LEAKKRTIKENVDQAYKNADLWRDLMIDWENYD